MNSSQASKSDIGWHCEWDESPSGVPPTEEVGSYHTSEGARDFEKSHSGAKKIKRRDEYLKVSSDDLWRVRAEVDGKKSSSAKTYKTCRETNDKVYMLNQQMGKQLALQ